MPKWRHVHIEVFQKKKKIERDVILVCPFPLSFSCRNRTVSDADLSQHRVANEPIRAIGDQTSLAYCGAVVWLIPATRD